MNPSILVVDDEHAFVDSVVRMLRLEGYDDFTPVTDSNTVPDLLASRRFDVAFLDITMPGLDGLDLLKVIKERSPHTECVMVTANDGISLVIKTIRAGAYDYLVKPITPEQLTHALDRARQTRGRPSMIVAHTIKGHGVSFMEGVIEYHGSTLSEDEVKQALAELEVPR